MAVTLISNLTVSVIGILLVTLRSKLKYLGPLRLLIGKLPIVPGAGDSIKPGLSLEVATLPCALRVISSRSGLMKNIPAGVLNIPVFFLNSSWVIPTSCAPLLGDGQAPCAFNGPTQLNVDRPALTCQGTPVV